MNQELHSTPLELWAIYAVAAVGLMVFGGLFARMWEDDNPFKCWYMGLSGPALASAFAMNVLQLAGVAGG